MSDSTFLVICALVLYFFPGLVAKVRGHQNYDAILLLNLLLGWTLLGWVVAMVWAVTAVHKAPSGSGGEVATPRTHVRCPDCRELVRWDASKCKHCGTALKPLPAPPG